MAGVAVFSSERTGEESMGALVAPRAKTAIAAM
jgi:hypothetical protein